MSATTQTHLEVEQAPPSASQPSNWRPSDTTLLRAMAAILVSNSHLEDFYKPRTWMAGDGLLGMSMFFFLSGFGIALARDSRLQGFFPWIWRRIMRIYPVVILSIVVIQLGVLQDWRTLSWREYPSVFIFPTTYGFVGHIMTVYVILYWLLNPRSRWPHVLVLTLTIALCLVCYARLLPSWPANEPLALGNPITTSYHWFYYTSAGLLGALFSPATRRPRNSLVRDLALLVGITGAYIATKFAMVHGHYPRWFIVLYLMAIGITLLLLRVSASDQLHAFFARIKPIGWLVSLLAAISLEMYIVQFWTHASPTLQTLRFPLNLLAFWVTTIGGAAILSKVTAQLVARWRPPRRQLPVS